jgi:arylsulfatase A
MAADWTYLTDFYATALLCFPSRAGLFTGRYPIRTMVTSALYPSGSLMNPLLDTGGYYSHGIRGIPEDEVLISEILQRRGYKTGIIGKWHLGDHSPHLPNERGFDEFYGALYCNDMDHYEIYRNDYIELEHPVDQNEITKLMTTEAIMFLNTNASHPKFLTLAHPMPHEPMHASDNFRGQSSAGIYGDSVEEIDWSVGEIIRTIKELGQDDRTIVFFTSDNGPWWQGNPGFTRGRKILPFKGGFRVPFIARWPGKILQGVACESLSIDFDLSATCLEIAGADNPNDRVIDGKSILSLLKGDPQSVHTTLFFYRAKTIM